MADSEREDIKFPEAATDAAHSESEPRAGAERLAHAPAEAPADAGAPAEAPADAGAPAEAPADAGAPAEAHAEAGAHAEAPPEMLSPNAPAASRPRDWRKWAKLWAFALVPAWGLFELGAHVKQTRSVVPEADWKIAKQVVAQIVQPADLVVFAPRWTDPLGREFFGDDIATVEREAYPDATRYPRAIEVSIRGKHTPELAQWRKVDERKVGSGAISIITLENPSPAKVIDDLLNHAKANAMPDGMTVYRVDGSREAECHWLEGTAQTGGLGFGPAVPAHRFACAGGNFVGVSIIDDLDNRPRRCFYAPPVGGSVVLRARFNGVTFGQGLHGHVGMQQESERDRTGAPVTLQWKVGDKVLGRIVHNDGDGWKGFELATADLAGQKADLVAEISAPNGNHRQFCFEADTR